LSYSIKNQARVLEALTTGPKSRMELRKALGWSTAGNDVQVPALLTRMRDAGLVVALGSGRAARWALAPSVTVCPTCSGKGILKTPAK